MQILSAGKDKIKKDGEDASGELFYLVSELAENGESHTYVQMAQGLQAPYTRQLFGQLIEAVEFVHSKGIAHRDIKLENVFLDRNCNIKLADFGMAKAFDEGVGG